MTFPQKKKKKKVPCALPSLQYSLFCKEPTDQYLNLIYEIKILAAFEWHGHSQCAGLRKKVITAVIFEP
jgi:hypothetical protein